MVLLIVSDIGFVSGVGALCAKRANVYNQYSKIILLMHRRAATIYNCGPKISKTI